jgi:four helix bundle protein
LPEHRISADIGCWIFDIGGMSYRTLQVWQEARELALDVHAMTMKLPKFELYEQGSQIRRSSKSIRSNIVEGYGRRKYKADYLRFLSYAFASCLETEDHLESLFESKSLTDKPLFDSLFERNQILGRKLNRFIQSVENSHNEPNS